jgi:hypothetical protein
MRNFRPQWFFCLLILAATITLACGSKEPHIPQSVSVSPATANAQDFPNGQVQFKATAYYNTKPSPVNGVAATWSACSTQDVSADLISLSDSGVAQCLSGATRNYTVYAFVPDPTFHGACGSVSLPCGGSCGGVVGSAQLTCP